MRYDPRGINVGFLALALTMASLMFYTASAHAVEANLVGSQIRTLTPPVVQTPPVAKGTPRKNLNWSELGQLGKARKGKMPTTSVAQLRAKLKPADEYATLYAIQVALSRVGDGQTYVWGRPKRNLRALITPVMSFRSAEGMVCRELLVSLALGGHIKRIATTACRNGDKVWHLES